MNILVLGDSDTSGRFSGGVTWPQILRDSLAAGAHPSAEVVTVRFSAANESAAGYAEKKIGEASPDVVVLVLGSFPFTAKFVWLRLERIFGKRAGRWYKAREDSFDDGTRERGRGLGSLNKFAHRLVPKIVGAAPFCSRKELTENYRSVFSTLARFEDSRIIILTYPGIGAHARQGNAPAERKVFFADLEASARAHHFTWLDGVEAFSGSAGTVKTDDLHFNAGGHQLMAKAIESAVLEPGLIEAAR